MPGESEKGAFSADIPSDAIEEALRSVEKADAPDAEAEVPVEAAPEAAPEAAEGVPAEQARLAAQLELSMQKGRETLARLKEEHDRFLRAAADLENFKKRAAKERDEVQKFGNERLLKDLIPVLDNLERALAAAPEGDPMAKGVKLVLRAFEETLGRHGVKAFSALGQPFDPRLHEAVMQVAASGDQAAGTVVREHGRGFLLHDRLVRPALVGVAAAPAEAAPQGGAAPGATGGEPDPAPGQAGGQGGGGNGRGGA